MSKHTPGQAAPCDICGVMRPWIERPFPELSGWGSCPTHIAAPELLEAAQQFMEFFQPSGESVMTCWRRPNAEQRVEIVRRFAAAIAKATNEN